MFSRFLQYTDGTKLRKASRFRSPLTQKPVKSKHEARYQALLVAGILKDILYLKILHKLSILKMKPRLRVYPFLPSFKLSTHFL